MIQLDGIEYEVKNVNENTDDLITFINTYCEANNITNEYGELIQIDTNEANPLYLIMYSIGYAVSVLQKLIYNTGCSLSIPEATERQLLNIADAAGIKRSQATRTVIRAVVNASLETESTGVCEITMEDSCTVIVAGQEVTFHPAYAVQIPVGSSAQVILVADDYGAFNISANTITQFDSPIENFRSMTTQQSTPGQSQETIAAFRARLQKRSIEGSQIDRAATAIQGLEGVAMCNIYFNYSPRNNETVMIGTQNVIVPPRQALLLVQGYNADIAKVFYRYVTCQTVNSENAISQNYITKVGQNIPVYITPPALQEIYIKMFFNNELSQGQVDGIKDTICSLAGTLSIGATATSVDVINVVSNVYNNLTIQGCQVSLDGSTYDYKVDVGVASIPSFNRDNITITGL